MTKSQYLQILTGEALVQYHGYLCEICYAKDLKLHFIDVNNGDERFTTTYSLLATSNDFEYVSRDELQNSSPDAYEIIYDYDDECGTTTTNITEEFIGDWLTLQDYIKTMMSQGCYNIVVKCNS